jgi:tRNA nucleotidyltransferase/poly(A) polymerase
MKLRQLLQKMLEVQKRIGSTQPYICGGTPRDKYLNQLDKISDVDITTGDKTVDYLSQEFAIELKKQYNIVRKTMSDGHSSIFIGNLKMDFSSNFNAPGIDKILNDIGIAKPTSMQKELFSRDFTCNSLLLSFDLKNVIDPTNRGFKDIKDKTIRTCLAPNITLTTNKNRVIRSVYLAAKLDFDIDKSIIEYVKQHPESVKISTSKALSEKLNEAFKWNPDRASYFITQMNLWNYIPINQSVYPYYIKHVKGGTNV